MSDSRRKNLWGWRWRATARQAMERGQEPPPRFSFREKRCQRLCCAGPKYSRSHFKVVTGWLLREHEEDLS